MCIHTYPYKHAHMAEGSVAPLTSSRVSRVSTLFSLVSCLFLSLMSLVSEMHVDTRDATRDQWRQSQVSCLFSSLMSLVWISSSHVY